MPQCIRSRIRAANWCKSKKWVNCTIGKFSTYIVDCLLIPGVTCECFRMNCLWLVWLDWKLKFKLLCAHDMHNHQHHRVLQQQFLPLAVSWAMLLLHSGFVPGWSEKFSRYEHYPYSTVQNYSNEFWMAPSPCLFCYLPFFISLNYLPKL